MITHDKVAFQSLLGDLVENILRYADNPGVCSKNVTHQIRELIGVRLVAIVAHEPGKDHDLVGICPPRMEAAWNQPPVQQFINSVLGFDTPRLIDPATDPSGNLLMAAGFGKSFVIPLLVGQERVGVMVLIDLLDDRGVQAVLEVLVRISSILALVLKNSYLYRNMEHLA
ncbi:MAG: histidine kinase, partial [Candidatus Omnitrophica bacterium]|nr:histidine kinase [Candidatus Omnitrophota bacterium]